MIELKGVSKTYKTKKGVKTLALDNVSFKLPNQGLFFILGKSGSGKSTLLNILGGLDQYDSGEMIIDSKSTKAFQEKDFDYYRNTYLGFIFQEFHLLEEYNVYDNIILSKKLQKEKVSQVVVDNLLNKVGIAGLGKRRINELSGGQKGRVAIARALIKNPKIILADEPTGNLDAETGIQIFELLKSISKEQLVIVVSHDKESALKYADGIIEISDGKVISNSVSFHLEEKAQFHSEKSKLPFFSSLKLAYLNLKNHKLKLLFTTLLTFMAVLFFGISLVLTKFDIEESHVKTMKNNNNGYITIHRWWDTIFGRSGVSLFYEPEIEEVKNKIGNTPYQLMYWPMENNNRVILDINEENVKPNESFSNFIGLMEINPSFVELKMIKGTMPQKYDEVLFSKSLADIILKYGIKLYNEEKYVQPSSYEDIFQYTYQFGTGYFKITGIVENEEKILFSDNLVFGIPGFVEHLTLKPNTTLPRGEFTIYSKQKEREFDLGTNFNTMNTEISAFDGTEMKSVKSLKENEIVVSEAYLNQLSDGDYNSLKRTYLEKNANVENAHIEFLKNYLKENHSLDEKISLTLYDKIGKREFKTFKNLTIVGISLESDAFYLPDTIFTKIMKKNYKINSMILKETNEEKLRKLLHEFPTSIDNDYSGNTVYSVYFGQFTKSLLNSVTLFFRILSCIFGLFAIMLLTNFITTTIYKSKKEIGILRALGARKKDILGIFLKEGMIIGLMAFLLSVVGLYSIVNFLNEFISRDWSFKMELVIVRPNTLILLFVSVVTIIFISSLFTVGKIAKMKPVDAISNK